MSAEEDPPKGLENLPLSQDLDSFERMDSKQEDLHTTEISPCIPQPLKTSENPNCSLPNSSSPKKKIHLSENGRVRLPTGKEIEERVRQRFGVNRDGYFIGIAGIVLILLCLLIILLMATLWPRLPHSYLYPVCTKASCLRASAEIIPRMDQSASPCLALYKYSCGGWNSDFPKPPATRSRWSPKEELRLLLREKIRDVIATLPHPTRVSSMTWKMKYFYESCMAIDNIETDSKRPLKKIINELGGWSVLREFSVLAWDLTYTFIRIHSEYGVSPFIKVTVVPNSQNNTSHILKLEPSGLGLPDVTYYHRDMHNDRIVASYRDFMKDVVQLLGATSTDAKAFADDMFYFERRIAEVTPSKMELEDLKRFQVMTVAQLKTSSPSIPVHGLLSALLPSVSIDDSTPVLVASPLYMTAVSNIMATTDRAALNNYFMWNLAKTYLPYLSQDLLDIQFVYDRDRKGTSEPLERWEICINAMEKFQKFALAVKLQQTIPEEVRKVNQELVLKMFKLIRDTVKESVTKAEWIDLELYKHIIKKLENMEVIVGYSNQFSDDNYLEEYYNTLFVQKNDFFQNIRYGVAFINNEMLKRFPKSRKELFWLNEMSEPKVSYIESQNKILVPQTILIEPYFDKDYPPSILFGRLGTEMARRIISGIFGPLGLYTAEGSLLPLNGLVANLSSSAIQRQLDCLGDNRTAFDTFLQLSAVRQALKALKKDGRERVHIHQPGLEIFEDDSLFLIGFVQELCVSLTSQQLDLENNTSSQLSSNELVGQLTRQLKAGEAFGCAQSSAACKHFL